MFVDQFKQRTVRTSESLHSKCFSLTEIRNDDGHVAFCKKFDFRILRHEFRKKFGNLPRVNGEKVQCIWKGTKWARVTEGSKPCHLKKMPHKTSRRNDVHDVYSP